MAEELKVQYRMGDDSKQDEFLDFINYVFHFNGVENDFYRLLPKLYKKENHPCEYNYLALEDDRIKAAVGSFPGKVSVCGIELNYYGIGNVAVHPYCRSKGYMKALMNQAMEDMLKKDVDFSVLSGRRNRYGYFSYELAGRKYCFWLDESNVKHYLKENRKGRFQFVPLSSNDTDDLRKIDALQVSQPLHYHRDASKLFDILTTWNAVEIIAVYEAERFAGYILFYEKSTIKEILLCNEEDIAAVIGDFVTVYATKGLNIELPEYQHIFINTLTNLSENVSLQVDENFTVFHYGRVVEAFLKLKSQSDRLMDGEVTLLIHGKKKDELLNIKVKDNCAKVTQTNSEPEYEFSHQEAMSVLFNNYSPLRRSLMPEVQSWLPLPLYIFPADLV